LTHALMPLKDINSK